MKKEGTPKSPKDQALADLVVLAFFFLLRVGKYTPRAAVKRAPPNEEKGSIVLAEVSIGSLGPLFSAFHAGRPPNGGLGHCNIGQPEEWAMRRRVTP